MVTMATTLARLARSFVRSPRRKTPSSEPKVTPAILNASHRIWFRDESHHASAARISPKPATARRETNT